MYINITMVFPSREIDLRIPTNISVKELIQSLEIDLDKFNVLSKDTEIYAIKVPTKNLVISDFDILEDYPITNGDVLEIIK